MLIPTPYDDFERLFSGAGFDVSKKNYLDFAQYAALLVDWNEKINLTAITGAAAITEKHFLDSVYPLKLVEIPENSVVVDVGTGAGFPGIPLKIMRPDLKLVLVDSLNKRVNFLQKVIGSLELRASKALHLRAENGGKLPILREQADVATARAVASLPTLCEYCLPYVKVGGFFMALKGPNEDVEEAFPAISELEVNFARLRSTRCRAVTRERS